MESHYETIGRRAYYRIRHMARTLIAAAAYPARAVAKARAERALLRRVARYVKPWPETLYQEHAASARAGSKGARAALRRRALINRYRADQGLPPLPRW